MSSSPQLNDYWRADDMAVSPRPTPVPWDSGSGGVQAEKGLPGFRKRKLQ